MSTMIQVRNVPGEAHRQLKSRAALEGMTLSAYVLRLVERDLQVPPLAELLRRLESREPVELEPSAAALVREDRDGR